ncbi:hypothetical protein ACFSKN_15070 [Mariniflexile gromovii]|uniref:Uncharacterized protein n=1 Tax=Mariniflexile gromovii TaxID=362523 RepID=A0ABS4BZ63_9FLAO|nr:hypothetical protein [Mariniflexile gromovii]MBP0905859.1 hypothetical protein [Mariniflexile gromovii]
MRKIIFIFLIAIISTNYIIAQEVTVNDNITIDIKKVKKAPTLFHTQQNVKVKGDGLEKIMIKSKIKSENKEDVDVNPLSLLDTVNKVRYQLVEFVGYKSFSIGVPTYQGKELLKTKLLNKRGHPYQSVPDFDPKIKDTFEDYQFEGYKNITCQINFGTDKNPIVSGIYYAPITMNSFIADAFFAIQKFDKEPVFVLYYGNEKVADIDIDLD